MPPNQNIRSHHLYKAWSKFRLEVENNAVEREGYSITKYLNYNNKKFEISKCCSYIVNWNFIPSIWNEVGETKPFLWAIQYYYIQEKSAKVQVKQQKEDNAGNWKVTFNKESCFHVNYCDYYHVLHAIPQCKKLLKTHVTFNFWNLCCNTAPIFFWLQ